MGYDGLENETQETQVDNLGQNTHISYITNHTSYDHKSNNQLSNNNLDIIKNIVSYLNDKTESKFKYTTKSTQRKINARLNEGYKFDDFIAVIDKKYKEWKNTEFEQYLCPDTLFGTKFEKYLNQKVNRNKRKTKNDEQWDFLKGVYDGTIEIN